MAVLTVFEIADALRACLDAAFTGDAGKPAEICHRPGAQVPFSYGQYQDECCSGLGWVRVASIDPVVTFDQREQPSFSPCNVSDRRITLELGVARCNPSGDQSAGPTCDEWTALALRMDQDARAMREAVCCFADAHVDSAGPLYRAMAGLWTPIEASGGCAGGTTEVTVWLNCKEC